MEKKEKKIGEIERERVKRWGVVRNNEKECSKKLGIKQIKK